MLRTYGAFSRHLPKGAIRIGAVSDQNEILVSAYNTDKGQVAVILNQGVKPYLLDLDRSFSKMEITSWSKKNEQRKVPEKLVIAPGEIITILE